MRDRDALGYAENYGGWAIAAVNRGLAERAGTMTTHAIHFAKIFLGEINSGENYSGGINSLEKNLPRNRRGYARG